MCYIDEYKALIKCSIWNKLDNDTKDWAKALSRTRFLHHRTLSARDVHICGVIGVPPVCVQLRIAAAHIPAVEWESS